MTLALTRLSMAGLAIALVLLLAQGTARAATFTVNSTADTSDAVLADGICVDAFGNCTLRAAIEQANFLPDQDYIGFNIPGTGPQTIQPLSPLPDISRRVFIDGYSQPGASMNTAPLSGGTNAVLKIELDGTSAGSNVPGLKITSGLNQVRGLAINRFSGHGIWLEGVSATGNIISGNFIGTNVGGTLDLGNGSSLSYFGIYINSGAANMVGGSTPDARNVVSGNSGSGIQIDDPNSVNNSIIGNLVGTDSSGQLAIGNGNHGISLLYAQSTTVGGPGAGYANVISGNDNAGIALLAEVTGTSILGNLIGTTADGAGALGNTGRGVQLFISTSTANTTIAVPPRAPAT